MQPSMGLFNQFEAGPFWQNGPRPGAHYHFPGNANTLEQGPITVTQNPINTGTSVIGVHTKDAVVVAADCGVFYGSLARYKDVNRLLKVNENILLGAGGDFADFQYIKQLIEQKILDEKCTDDGFSLKPKSLYSWLTRIMYNRRSRFDPLWNFLLVAGFEDGKPFLGSVDKLGTAFTSNVIGTNYSVQLAVPLVSQTIEQHGEITTEQAIDILHKCFEVLYYRDARSFPRYSLGIITEKGIEIRDPVTIEQVYH